MRTLKDLKENIEEILKNHPEWESLPIIYSSDDKGNSFHKVYADLSPLQVEDITDYYLELVYDEEDNILLDKANCICIN